MLAQRALDCRRVADVADNQRGLGRDGGAVAAKQRIEHDDLVAGLDQPLCRGAADVARAAGDEDPHCFASSDESPKSRRHSPGRRQAAGGAASVGGGFARPLAIVFHADVRPSTGCA